MERTIFLSKQTAPKNRYTRGYFSEIRRGSAERGRNGALVESLRAPVRSTLLMNSNSTKRVTNSLSKPKLWTETSIGSANLLFSFVIDHVNKPTKDNSVAFSL